MVTHVLECQKVAATVDEAFGDGEGLGVLFGCPVLGFGCNAENRALPYMDEPKGVEYVWILFGEQYPSSKLSTATLWKLMANDVVVSALSCRSDMDSGHYTWSE